MVLDLLGSCEGPDVGLSRACLFSPRGYAFASGNGTMISALPEPENQN